MMNEQIGGDLMKPKITLTDELIFHISKVRTKKKINARLLSKDVGKPDGYISSIETGKVKTIASKTLIKIFELLHNESEKESIVRIESLLIPKESSENKVQLWNITDFKAYNLPKEIEIEIILHRIKEVGVELEIYCSLHEQVVAQAKQEVRI